MKPATTAISSAKMTYHQVLTKLDAPSSIRVGEETGSLDQQLEVAAAYYNRELETKLERATSLFEPAIIVVMGVVVGFVAVALVSAMYGIYNQVKA